jgi:hypothetical protein
MAVTWLQILAKSAALMNDQDRAVYTDIVLLPYLNMARLELQEVFELNEIPVTAETSAIITVPAGVAGAITSIPINAGTVPLVTPSLPIDLVEIQQLFESYTGQNNWVPMTKKEYLTPSMLVGNTPIAVFGVWAWMNQEIRVPSCSQINDLKIDYIKSLFTEMAMSDLTRNNNIINTDTFFQYRVAGLVSEFIEENLTRSQGLNQYGVLGLERSLGINVKGMQSIAIRRRPFRAAYKRRKVLL